MPHDHYQTVKEVADRLKVGEASVRNWIKTNALRAIDVGKGWRIADTDLERFLNGHQTIPRAQATDQSDSLGHPSQATEA